MSTLRNPRPSSPIPWSRNLTLIVLAILALLLAACDGDEPEQLAAARTVTVSGTGRANAQADISRVLFGFWVKEEDANTAIANSAARLAEITAALTGLGIDPADIAANSLSMNSEQIFGPDGYPTERLLYAVNQNVTVTVRDPGLLGGVLNSVRVTAGAPYIYSLSVEPQVSPQRWNQILAEAQSQALADAEIAAQNLARQLGQSLVEPLTVKVVSQDGSGGPLLQAYVVVEVSYGLQAGDTTSD